MKVLPQFLGGRVIRVLGEYAVDLNHECPKWPASGLD
jgi:hypothetical protein